VKDLVVLVADKNMEQALEGLLKRSQALHIRPLTYDLFVHPRRDPGCLNEAHDFLRPFSRAYKCAMVMYDHVGSGQEQKQPHVLADAMKKRLQQNGWGCCEAVVLSPELEVWVWSSSPHVDVCLGWADHEPPLREWLATSGFWPLSDPKPRSPREALEQALREVRKPRSSAIYLSLAERVSLHGHSEPAFLRFIQALQCWFPE